jgi:hypothetical protein
LKQPKKNGGCFGNKTTGNIGFCNIGAEAMSISIGSLLGFGSGRSFSIIFCTLFVHLFFNWAAVPGGRISNSPTSQSPIVTCHIIATHNHYNTFTLLPKFVWAN